jgi:signal peptide peptidase SppA
VITDLLHARAWAMEPRALRDLVSQLAGIDMSKLEVDAVFDPTQRAKAPELEVNDGTAKINIHGVILKSVPWYFALFDIDATSTLEASELLRDAVARDDVKRVELDVDSPGGTIDGVPSLAEEIRAARAVKPVATNAPDLMASAGYWLGSQATKINAGSAAAIGSIGVYTTLIDASEAYGEYGYKVDVVRSHELKGIGAGDGSYTDEQRAEVQRVIDQYASVFIDAVAEGRGVDRAKIEAVATGQVFIGADAKRKGLVDTIDKAKAPKPAAKTSADALNPQEPHMAEDQKILARLEQLEAETKQSKAENERLRDELAKRDAAAKVQESTRKEAVIKKYADRYFPTAKGHVDALAEKCDTAEELEAFLAAMPTVTNAEQVGGDSSEPVGSCAKPLGRGEAEVCRGLGITAEQFQKYGDADRIDTEGNAYTVEGEVIQ